MHLNDLCFLRSRRSAAPTVLRLTASLLLPLLAACASAPVQEMSEARQAIEAARVAGAEQHAPEGYQKATALLQSAEDMLNEHHYSRAREDAALARDEAIQARETAQKASSGNCQNCK
jgi:hypothetical protein